MHDFHGWTAGALWEDLKFDFKHWKDIERLAIVGESKWEAGMAVVCKPFTAAKIQYLDLRNGPMIFEAPPQALGVMDDMWFRWISDFGLPGAERGESGKYLVVPPEIEEVNSE